MTMQKPEDPKRLLIAEIVGAHGVRGDAKIRIYAEDATLAEQDEGLYTSATPDDHSRLHIALKKPYKSDIWLAQISGITTPEQIKAMGKTPLYIEASALPAKNDDAKNSEQEDDSFYFHELEGLAVYQDDNGAKGKEVGIVTAVQNFGASDLLDIRARNGSQFYHPFTKEDVPVLDIENGYLTIIQADII